ncbi:MAG TPA: hypothetical protein VMT81_00410 [Candidatus Paceibacterota bacterium]|nr:hypothetical protein [Candidatus Paceibacterota bacterium]
MPPDTTSTIHTLAAAYTANLGWLDLVGALVSALFIAGIVLLVIKTNWLGLRVERFRHVILQTELPKEMAKKEWAKIEEHFFRGDENDLKIAIIEADKLLEEALKEGGYRGASLGDRLKNLKPSQLPNLDHVWQAHRLRNQIVHEPTFKLKRDLAEKALRIYEDTLKQFGLLGR